MVLTEWDKKEIKRMINEELDYRMTLVGRDVVSLQRRVEALEKK
jgi:hypothetical protein